MTTSPTTSSPLDAHPGSSGLPFGRLALAVLAAMTLLLAACGGSEEVDAGAGADDELPAESDDGLPTEPDDGPADDGAVDGEYQVTQAHLEMISSQPAAIDEVRVIDENTLGVRYQSGSEPCSRSNVTVTESDTEVTVALETGLHPDAAAMSCIAQVIGYEIQVTLGAPLGERTIVPVPA